MKLRLYIGDRRFCAKWIKIDDIFILDAGEEIIEANKGAQSLLESTRQRIRWKLKQENKIFVGNIWETEQEVNFNEGILTQV